LEQRVESAGRSAKESSINHENAKSGNPFTVFGHLLQWRCKAPVVEGAAGDYLGVVSTVP
jgi:hypothetical protein